MTPHIYIITYNEALIIAFTIAHYRERFPDCPITIYDNQSTDSTVDIALSFNCEVIPYDTGGKLDDATYLQIKNNCWKEAKEDWVIVCDADELLAINDTVLLHFSFEGITIVKGIGYNMVNLVENSLDLESMKYGVRSESYDKLYCFNRKFIREINYGPGCHNAAPEGTIKVATAICYHYKYIEKEYMVKRHNEYGKRLSENNKKHGYGGHYEYSADKIREEFDSQRWLAVKVR